MSPSPVAPRSLTPDHLTTIIVTTVTTRGRQGLSEVTTGEEATRVVVWWHDTCDTCDDMTCLQLSVRTSCVLICCTYLVFHAAFLVINFILLADTESHLHQIAAYTQATESGD